MTWILKYNNIQFKQNQNHNKNNYLQVKKTMFEKSRFSDFKQSYKFDHTTLNLYVNIQQTLSNPNKQKENKKRKKKRKPNFSRYKGDDFSNDWVKKFKNLNSFVKI